MASMYSTVNMNTFPGEMKLPGKTVAQQAKSVDYQDIPRDIQAMREADYNKEVKEGEFVPEFSGVRNRGLGRYFGEAAKKTAPGLLLAGAIFAIYWMFYRKKEETMLGESAFEPAENPDAFDEDADNSDFDFEE